MVSQGRPKPLRHSFKVLRSDSAKRYLNFSLAILHCIAGGREGPGSEAGGEAGAVAGGEAGAEARAGARAACVADGAGRRRVRQA